MSEQIPQIIDQMPPAGSFNTARQLNPTLERVDAHLLNGFDPTAGAEALEVTLVRNFGQELQWGNPENHDALVKSAYGISRELGDRSLRELSTAAYDIVDGTRSFAKFNTSFRANANEVGSVHSTVDENGAHNYHMSVDVSEAYQKGTMRTVFESRLRDKGVEVAAADISTLTMLFIAGHEAGHVIQGGINKALPVNHETMHDSESNPAIDATARQILTQNPSRGRTGNMETDSRIYNEQFAESYGFLVVSRAAAALGYDEKTISVLVESFAHQAEELESLNHLDKVTSEKSLRMVLKEEGSAAYHGEAGYNSALKPEDIAKDLELLNEAFKNGTLQQTSSAAYAERFAAYTRMASRLEAAEPTVEVKQKRDQMARLFNGKLRNRS